MKTGNYLIAKYKKVLDSAEIFSHIGNNKITGGSMKENIAIKELENAKRKILQTHLKKEMLEEFDSIERAINILRGQQESAPLVSQAPGGPTPPASSLQGLVINAVVDLIHKRGRQVSNDEIINYLEEKQISLGSSKNKRGALASMLFKESNKSDGKIKQVERGKYYLK